MILALQNDHLDLFFALAIDEYSKLINLSTACVTINQQFNKPQNNGMHTAYGLSHCESKWLNGTLRILK